MIRLNVKASKRYEVLIGDGLIHSIGGFVSHVCNSNRVAVVTDDIVDSLYGQAVVSSLRSGGFIVSKLAFANGEESKNIGTLSSIWEFLAANSFTRSDMLIALGGGVVGDITGFAAATYMRGVSFIQIPTTLLAAVDASVGGKTAIDLAHGKNLAGVFWQPSLVLCDCDVIRHLPKEIFSNGMAEVIKHGFLGDEAILSCIDDDGVMERLLWLIQRNVEIKRNVVEADELENGKRRILNFGHTVAHAIEKLSEYRVPHGIAVGIGMVYETRMAEKLGLCQMGLAVQVERYCQKYGLFVEQNITDVFIDVMMLDKKNEDNCIVFALPESVGSFVIKKFSKSEVASLLC